MLVAADAGRPHVIHNVIFPPDALLLCCCAVCLMSMLDNISSSIINSDITPTSYADPLHDLFSLSAPQTLCRSPADSVPLPRRLYLCRCPVDSVPLSRRLLLYLPRSFYGSTPQLLWLYPADVLCPAAVLCPTDSSAAISSVITSPLSTRVPCWRRG